MNDQRGAHEARFRLEEATIDDLHRAIRAGETTCVAVVAALHRARARLQRRRAACSSPRTARRSPRRPARCAARSPLRFPTQTVKASTHPARSRQVPGPAARIRPHGGDGLRSRRAAAVRHDRRHPERRPGERARHAQHPRRALGDLPRRLRPASRRSGRCRPARRRCASTSASCPTRSSARPSSTRPTAAIPISRRCRCTASCSRSRTRSTPRTCARPAAATRAYDIDFPARDHVLVEQLRNKGAIIFAKAVNTEYNGRAGDPGGRHKPDKVLPSTLGYQRSTWAGNPSNPYDTTRSASLGSSSGSGVSVSANLVMASLGEETRASCRGPSNHNAVALILPHKAMLGFDGGAIGADIYCDRSGIHCRTIARLRQGARCAEGPGRRLLRPARSLHDGAALVGAEHALCEPRAGRRATPGALAGHAARRHPRIDGLSRRARRPRSRSSPPPRRRSRPSSASSSARRWSNRPIRCGQRDPDVEPMKTDFRRALARLVPVFMPDLLFRLRRGRARRCSRNSRRRSCRPSSCRARCSARGTMKPIDYCVELAEGRIAPPANLDLATIQQQELAMTFRFHIPQYLSRRAADWKARGLHRNADRFRGAQRALQILGRRPARRLQELGGGHRPAQSARPAPGRQRAHHAARTAAPRRHDGDPGEPARRAGAPAHAVAAGPDRRRLPVRHRRAICAGIAERAERRPDRGADPGRLCHDRLRSGLRAQRRRQALRVGRSDKPTTIPEPGLPFSLVFRAEPGKEDVLLKIASAYEAASKRRIPPPAFGPLKASGS